MSNAATLNNRTHDAPVRRIDALAFIQNGRGLLKGARRIQINTGCRHRFKHHLALDAGREFFRKLTDIRYLRLRLLSGRDTDSQPSRGCRLE